MSHILSLSSSIAELSLSDAEPDSREGYEHFSKFKKSMAIYLLFLSSFNSSLSASNSCFKF